MKKKLKIYSIYALIPVLLIGCTGKTSTESAEVTEEPVEEVPVKKELSLDEKAKNMFTNTMVVFSGSMFVAFSEVFKGQAEAFAEAFDAELNEESIKAIDDKIAGLDDETMLKLEEMKIQLDQAFDSLAQADRSMYDKIFLHETMKEGVALAESQELPEGFPPLSNTLSIEELKRYIIKIAAHGQNQEDPVIKSFADVATWMQKVGPELEKDEAIKNFMAGMN